MILEKRLRFGRHMAMIRAVISIFRPNIPRCFPFFLFSLFIKIINSKTGLRGNAEARFYMFLKLLLIFGFG